MANDQLPFKWPATGATIYVTITAWDGTIWNGSAFETYVVANIGTYDVAATETPASSYRYLATFPGSIAAGSYIVEAYLQSGGSPAVTDVKIGGWSLAWDGSAIEFGADVTAVDGSAAAATALKQTALTVAIGTVQADGSNSATSFKIDSTLGAKAADYFGASDGGLVLQFISGSNNEYLGRRISAFNTTTDFVTVETAFPATPTTGNTFVLIGRIEA